MTLSLAGIIILPLTIASSVIEPESHSGTMYNIPVKKSMSFVGNDCIGSSDGENLSEQLVSIDVAHLAHNSQEQR